MPTFSRRFLQIVACLSLVMGNPGWHPGGRGSSPASAVAQPRKGGNRAASKGGQPPAKGSFERGLAALTEKDLPTATRLLTEAFRQSPRPEVLYHLGRVASAEGQALLAYDLFRRYLADPSREPDDAAVQIAEKAIENPPPQSGSLAIQSDPGALVLVDERVVGTLPLPLPVLLSPGAHSVVLEFAGKRFDVPVTIQATRVSELRVSRGSGAVLLSVLPAVLHISQQPSLAADLSRRLTDAMEQAARVEQHTLLGIETLLSQPAERVACLRDPSCPLELARKNKLSWVLQQRIVPTGDANNPAWQVSLRLRHVEVSEPAAESELTLPSGKIESALAALKDGVGKVLSSGLNRPRGTLQAVATPTQATLRIGSGQPLPLPFTGSLWAGSYELSVVLPGFRPHRETVTLREDQTSEVRAELQPEVIGNSLVTPPAPLGRERGPRPVWRLAVGGTLLGIGVGLAVAGGVGLAKDGQCTSEPEIAGGNCELLYRTALPGGVALGGGLGLVGAGVVLLALPGPWRTVSRR
ncbi:MAG TPA: PEGA domain-containing protein [Pseudomonadota bacterium]|nr:PEGA domain-containing protein [Pseudomonadota bacterium]